MDTIQRHLSNFHSVNTILPIDSINKGSSICNSAVDFSVLHTRLGHASIKKMKHIFHISFTKADCHICSIAKMHRLPFLHSTSHSSEPFQLIHIDVWGPYWVRSATGAQFFFFTIVDDFSRAVWKYMMQYKSQAFQNIKIFVQLVETQYNTSVKTICTDNGGEFVNSHCKEFFSEKGIAHQLTCPYTPQQNGVVEPKHRHLLDIARALKFQASIPYYLWSECVLAAAYIINRLLVEKLSWKSPYEMLHNRQPSYEHLKVIGCLCYDANITPQKDKFAARAIASIFIGYSLHHKAYKLYDIHTHSIFC